MLLDFKLLAVRRARRRIRGTDEVNDDAYEEADNDHEQRSVPSKEVYVSFVRYHGSTHEVGGALGATKV